MALRLSMLNWMRPEPLERTVERLVRCGYDGIELSAEPGEYDAGRVRELLDAHGLECWAVVSRMFGGRDLTHPDAGVRAATVEYVREALDFGGRLGARSLTLVPAEIGRTEPLASPADEWRFAVEGLRACEERAAEAGVLLAIEPLNRGETHFVNRSDQALALADEGGPMCGVCLDVFHMTLEEPDWPAALRAAGARLANVHVAEENRLPPGHGSVDWPLLLDELEDVGYDGFLSMEWIVRDVSDEEYEELTREGAAHLRRANADRVGR